MYKSKILDKFYEALFCTDFYDYESATQNAKTDELANFVTGPKEEQQDFEGWLDMLIDTYVKEQKELKEDSDDFVDIQIATKEEILKAIAEEPQFKEDMKFEFNELIDILGDDLFEEDDDEDEEEDED